MFELIELWWFSFIPAAAVPILFPIVSNSFLYVTTAKKPKENRN